MGLCWGGAGCVAEVNQDWLKKVPAAERAKANPYAGQAECGCGGWTNVYGSLRALPRDDLKGRHGKPALRTPVMAGATEGELFWLLRNGDLRHGMPSWSGLPEGERWQIVAFLKSRQ